MFNSYYWSPVPMSDPVLDAARAELREPTSLDASLGAFRTLLRSSSPAAVGVALDHFRYAEASSRFGTANPFLSEADAVVRQARAALDEPAVAKATEGAAFDGANHASALAALVNLAQPEDGARVTRALDSARDVNVRENALQLAKRIARMSAASPPLVDALLRAAGNRAWSSNERAEALGVLYRAAPAQGVRLALRHLLDPDLMMQARAAWVLLQDDPEANRDRVVALVADWPDDAPFPAVDVRLALEDGPARS